MVALRKSMSEAFAPGVSRTNMATHKGGRLMMRQVLRQEARVANGGEWDEHLKMFRQRTVARSHKAPPQVWFFGDVSGSMGSMAVPLAVTRWALSQATHQVGGKCGAVLYGSRAKPVQRFGSVPDLVEVYPCTDYWEVPAQAVSMAMYDNNFFAEKKDSENKFLVFFSDFQYSREYAELRAAIWMAKETSCHVVAVIPDFAASDNAEAFGIETVVRCSDPVTTARHLGNAITRIGG